MDQALPKEGCRLGGRHCVWLWIVSLFDRCMSGKLWANIRRYRFGWVNVHTLEYALDFSHLCRIVELPKLFCLLRQFFSLHQGVALVSYEVRCGVVEGGYECGEIDVCGRLSVLHAQRTRPRRPYFSMPQLPFGTCSLRHFLICCHPCHQLQSHSLPRFVPARDQLCLRCPCLTSYDRAVGKSRRTWSIGSSM